MIYTYMCLDCGKPFERSMPLAHYVGNIERIECPNCLSKNFQRTYNVTNVIYKDRDFTKYVEGEE